MDGEELHHTKVLRRPGRGREDILRRPVNQLWSGLSGAAEAMIIKMGPELGDAVGRGVDPSQAGGVVVLPELETLVKLRGTGIRRETPRLSVTVSVESLAVDVPVPLVDG